MGIACVGKQTKLSDYILMLLKSVLLIVVFKKDTPFSEQQLIQIIQDLGFPAKKIKRLTMLKMVDMEQGLGVQFFTL